MKQRKLEVRNVNKYICKCGHRVIIPAFRDKQLCHYCGEYIFADKRKEFEYRLIEKQRQVTAQ